MLYEVITRDSGGSPAEVAEARGLALSTVQRHLVSCLRWGRCEVSEIV